MKHFKLLALLTITIFTLVSCGKSQKPIGNKESDASDVQGMAPIQDDSEAGVPDIEPYDGPVPWDWTSYIKATDAITDEDFYNIVAYSIESTITDPGRFTPVINSARKNDNTGAIEFGLEQTDMVIAFDVEHSVWTMYNRFDPEYPYVIYAYGLPSEDDRVAFYEYIVNDPTLPDMGHRYVWTSYVGGEIEGTKIDWVDGQCILGKSEDEPDVSNVGNQGTIVSIQGDIDWDQVCTDYNTTVGDLARELTRVLEETLGDNYIPPLDICKYAYSAYYDMWYLQLRNQLAGFTYDKDQGWILVNCEERLYPIIIFTHGDKLDIDDMVYMSELLFLSEEYTGEKPEISWCDEDEEIWGVSYIYWGDNTLYLREFLN